MTLEDPEPRVCLLTGAGGELGSDFCRRYRDRYRIAAVYRSRPPEVADQNKHWVDPLRPSARLAENDGAVFSIRADLTREGELARVVELTLAHFGRIDVLVNAAVHSVWAPIVGSLALLDSLQRQFEVNAMVPLRLAVEVASAFWRDRDKENRAFNRNVVNVSSIAGLYIYPGSGQSVYSATKAALNNLTCHMAAEFAAFGVRVNAIAPDTFHTRVSLARVTDSIARLDDGTISGDILVLKEDGEERI